MSDFYYLYDPADTLALAQAISLANIDGGMSYIIPFANKTGVVDPTDPASAGLGVIETAIAAGPLHAGGSNNPESNRLTPSEFQGKVSAAQWTAIKAMVKASISQAPPAGWSDASLEAAGTTYSVISADGYNKTNELKTHLFASGTWHSADRGDRGFPMVAYGGNITTELFVDLSGHNLDTPNVTGEQVVSRAGKINQGILYEVHSTDIIVATDSGSRKNGLSIDAGNASVTVANFSVVSQGFGREDGATDAVAFAHPNHLSLGEPLHIVSGNVTLTGDIVIDQVAQVVGGTALLPAPLDISSGNSHVIIDNARVFLGSVRGYESMISVTGDASLEVKDSTVYGFSSSNSNGPVLNGVGLDWRDFENPSGSAALSSLISSANGGAVKLNGTTFLREDRRQATGEFSTATKDMGVNTTWADNTFRNTSRGDLLIGNNGSLEIINSKVIGSIASDSLAGSLLVKDSVVAGKPLGKLTGGSLVQLKGGSTTIENSLIDSLDATLLAGGSVKLDKTSHVLATPTPWAVPTTTNPTYSTLPSFANPSTQQLLQAWGDKDNGPAAKVTFQFEGPTGTVQTPSNVSLTLAVQLSEAALPVVGASGATTYSLVARFQEAVSGFDAADLQAALGTAAVAAGWQVASAPLSRDGGSTWTFKLQSPTSFNAPVSLQLAAGAASSTLVTGLTSSVSNSFNLVPLGGGGSPGVAVATRPTEVFEPIVPGAVGFASLDITRNGDISAATTVQITFDGGTATGAAPAPIEGNGKGLSSSSYPYILPVAGSGVRTTSILTTGDAVGSYAMVGTPDGLGAFDNNNGTFTLLVNHELSATAGSIRQHGAKGAFISSWIIDKSSLTVQSGADLIRNVYGWNAATQSSNTTPNNSANGNGISFNRFCSADLASPTAFYNPATGLGTQARLFLNGEEGGGNGFALANVASGANAGSSFILGKFNLSTNGSGLTGVGGWENLLANPKAQDKTIVIGNSDGGTGIMSNALAVYQGTKTASGSDADKAGLTNGAVKFVSVNGITAEIADSTTRATAITSGSRFSLSSTASTTFSRPEDGAWDPNNPNRYYFVTTDRLDTVSDGIGSQIGQTRLWRLTFDDISNPDLGGSIDLLVNGDIVNGQKVNMFDNITIDRYGHVLLQEDVGNAAHNGKIWQYDVASDSLELLTKFDPARFGDIGVPATLPFTVDEESSGIIDVQDILGAGWYLLDAQAHYPNTNPDLVEGGQILAMFNPSTYTKATDYINTPQIIGFAPGETVKSVLVPILGDAKPEYQESINVKIAPGPGSSGAFTATTTQILINDKTYLPGPINFNSLIGEGGTVNLDIDYLQGRLYGTDLLPKSGDFRLSPTSGGFSAEMPAGSSSKDYVQLTYVPGAAAQAVVQTEMVLNDLGVYETIASAARGLLPTIVHNYVHTGVGDDRIIGSAGVDFIRAGAGDDWVEADAGDDVVRPGSGNDQVRLGAGADALLMTRDQQLGITMLFDFSPEDRLVLADGVKVLAGIGTASLKVGDGLGSFKELILTGSSMPIWDQKLIQNA